MKTLTRTRTRLELRVGDHAVVQVILLVKRCHLEWFNTPVATDQDEKDQEDDSDSILSNRWDELYELLQDQVIPRCMEQNVEDSYYDPTITSSNRETARKRKAERPPTFLGPGGIPLSDKQSQQQSRPGKGPRKRFTKKQQKEMEQMQRQQESEQKHHRRAQQRDYQRAYGNTMQLAYKCESILATEPNQATLVFPTNEDSSDNDEPEKLPRLLALETLTKRLIVACGPWRGGIDRYEEDGSNGSVDEEDDGQLMLLQQEQIPIAALFRQPVEPVDDKKSNA